MTSPDQTPESSSANSFKSIKVWDRATRAWHWLTVLGIAGMWWTGENHWMSLHVTIGILLSGLLMFRLIWGIWGSTTARFVHFIRGPGAALNYVKGLFRAGRHQHFGHNPLGALSVVALLAAIVFQLGTGLVSIDTDGVASGPLSQFVSYDFGDEAADLHEDAFDVLLALIVLHLGAVAFYLVFKRVNLIRSMFTGKLSAPLDTSDDDAAKEPELKKPGPIAFLIAAGIGVATSATLFLI